MKKALLLVCILSVSVITTACINNLAVQELNNKAAAFMEKGQYSEAIERLKSSIDLDDTLYQTHYNLGAAYAKNDEYLNAVNAYNKTIELNPDFADAYYALAVVEENIITDVVSGVLVVGDDGNVSAPSDDIDDADENTDDVKSVQKELSPVAKAYINTMTADAVKNYEFYLEKNPQVSDKAEVEARISDLNSRLDNANSADLQR